MGNSSKCSMLVLTQQGPQRCGRRVGEERVEVPGLLGAGWFLPYRCRRVAPPSRADSQWSGFSHKCSEFFTLGSIRLLWPYSPFDLLTTAVQLLKGSLPRGPGDRRQKACGMKPILDGIFDFLMASLTTISFFSPL